MLEGRSIDQGTGTSFSPELDEVELPEVLDALLLLEPLGLLLEPLGLVLELLGLVLELLGLVLEPPGLLLPPEEALALSDRTAKSIRPEDGFKMTSLIVPKVLPVESVTCAPVN